MSQPNSNLTALSRGRDKRVNFTFGWLGFRPETHNAIPRRSDNRIPLAVVIGVVGSVIQLDYRHDRQGFWPANHKVRSLLAIAVSQRDPRRVRSFG